MYLTKVMSALQYPAALKKEMLSLTWTPESSIMKITRTKIHSHAINITGHNTIWRELDPSLLLLT
jgi:hypothetical protein